jgi:hypothetical protein
MRWRPSWRRRGPSRAGARARDDLGSELETARSDLETTRSNGQGRLRGRRAPDPSGIRARTRRRGRDRARRGSIRARQASLEHRGDGGRA